MLNICAIVSLALVLLVGWADWADAKYEMTTSAWSWSVLCNPPLKFTGNEKKDACFARCQKNPNCRLAVVDNNAKKNTCANVDKSAQCGPSHGSDESYTIIANIALPKYTVVENVDFMSSGLEVVDSVKSLAGFGGPYSQSEETCGKVCGLFKDCNGYSWTPGMGQSAGVCMFKTLTKPVTIGKDAQCVPKNAQGGIYKMYFAKAEYAPRKKC